jgi:hypothetical protein
LKECSDVVGKFLSPSVMIMETVGISETSLRFYQYTRNQSPEDSNIDSYHREERKTFVFVSGDVNTSVILSVASV